MIDRSRRLDAGTLLLLTLPPLFWAGNAVVGRLAVGSIGPMTLNAMRWLLAGLLIAPFAWRSFRLHREVVRRHWRVLTLLGICGMGSYNALQYLALTTSTPTNVTLIAASAPVFTMLLGAWRIGGAAVSIAGVAVVMLRGDASRLASLTFVAGDLFMLAAAAMWSLYTWILRARRPQLPPLVLLFAQILFGAAFCIACALVERLGFGIESHFERPRVWLVLAYVAVLPSIVGYLLWDRGVARVGAAMPIFFANLTPLFAALLSALLWAEGPRWYHAVGLVLIVAGIVLARHSGSMPSATRKRATML